MYCPKDVLGTMLNKNIRNAKGFYFYIFMITLDCFKNCSAETALYNVFLNS